MNELFCQILLEYKKCLELYSSRQRAWLRWLKMVFYKTSKLICANLCPSRLANILAQYPDKLQLSAAQLNRIATRLCHVIYYHSYKKYPCLVGIVSICERDSEIGSTSLSPMLSAFSIIKIKFCFNIFFCI